MAKSKAKATKEAEQAKVNEGRKLRDKQLAQLKASNEMLEAAKETILEHYGEKDEQVESLFEQIDIAKTQNVERAGEFLGATEKDMEAAKYNEVSEAGRKGYEWRLKKLGVTDEEVHRKVLVEPDTKPHKPTKRQSKIDELMSKLDKVRGMGDRKKSQEPDGGSENADYSATGAFVTEQDGMKDATQTAGSGEPSVMLLNLPEVREVHSIEEYADEIRKERPYRCDGFDPRDIPDYVQYDMIPLPSKGECYPHKKNCLPVAYLTAADENIIASPNMYNNGNLMDILLERKILDKTVRVSELTKGDRDAIIVWLRATAYGPEYPIVARYKGSEFETTVDLSKLKYVDFTLKGDGNGWFEYTTEGGDQIKFKYLTAQEEDDILQSNNQNFTVINTHDVIELGARMLVSVKAIDDENTESVAEAIEGIQKWADGIREKSAKVDGDLIYNNGVTARMCAYTMSVNGHTDRAYIKNYIENMRTSDARAYREFVNENVPRMDFNVTIDVPESLGGGSFTTFLGIGETVFINIK